MSDALRSAGQTRRKNYLSRNQSLVSRFNYLYEVERIRIEDVYERILKEYHLSQRRVDYILKGTHLEKEKK